MAEETITILKVGTEEAVRNIADLKANIKALKEGFEDASGTMHKGLNDLEIGTEEYKETLDELKINQNALKDAMYATSASMQQVTAAATGANIAFDENNKLVNVETISYNELVHAMANLKEEFRSTTDASKRMELGKQINEINTQLKKLDANQGNFQRNVGNYTSAIDNLSDAFKKTAGSAGNIINPVKNATTAFKAMSATPVISILGLLANVITKIISEMQKSEEATGKLTKAFQGFSAVGDLVTTILQKVGDAIAWVVGGFSNLVSAIFGVSDAQKERMKITEQEMELSKKQRENTKKDADAQLEIAKLREKASDSLLYTAAQRLEFQKQAGELEAEIAKRAYEDLKVQYEIVKAKNALTASSAEELQKEADAYAAMVKAETDYYNKVASNNKQMTGLVKESAKNAQDAVRARLQAEKALIDQEIELTEKGTEEELRLRKESRKKEYDLSVADAKAKVKDRTSLNKTLSLLQQKYNRDLEKLERDHQKTIESQRILHLQNLANQYAQGSIEYLAAMATLRKQEMENVRKEIGETDEQFNARRLTAQKNYNDAVRALNAKHYEESTAELRLALAKELGETEGYYNGMMILAQSNYENLQRLEGESDTEFAIRKQESYKVLKQAQKEYLDYLDNQEKLSLENRANTYQEGSIQYQEAIIDLRKWELDQVVTYGQLETETEQEFLARRLAAEKAYTESKKDLVNQQISLMQKVASSTSSILGSIADMYESDEENSEKNANKIKNLRIAAATIDTISGAIGAFMQASQTIPPPYGQIIGAAAAAAVTASGIAQIAKLKSTKVSGSASSDTPSTPAVAPAPTLTTEVSNVRSVTSASEEDRLNQMAREQRVYILASDIEASQNQIKTQVSESSF